MKANIINNTTAARRALALAAIASLMALPFGASSAFAETAPAATPSTSDSSPAASSAPASAPAAATTPASTNSAATPASASAPSTPAISSDSSQPSATPAATPAPKKNRNKSSDTAPTAPVITTTPAPATPSNTTGSSNSNSAPAPTPVPATTNTGNTNTTPAVSAPIAPTDPSASQTSAPAPTPTPAPASSASNGGYEGPLRNLQGLLDLGTDNTAPSPAVSAPVDDAAASPSADADTSTSTDASLSADAASLSLQPIVAPAAPDPVADEPKATSTKPIVFTASTTPRAIGSIDPTITDKTAHHALSSTVENASKSVAPAIENLKSQVASNYFAGLGAMEAFAPSQYYAFKGLAPATTDGFVAAAAVLALTGAGLMIQYSRNTKSNKKYPTAAPARLVGEIG